ncbi:molybdopterin-guanine dinucleotide biosynthesis protein [Sanguibacter hominis ATCC BAA-789]|uniref:Molybdopterin-guanine dinucleotide biosynthesis protein n=1 Tax=Sanguibacter hominis ATCC BAA-789 TaxID=1312740 RepID=A0A9X5FDB6_9MICO|nr:DUF6457 domain-containing protein [Sanguibacter hominis]NKX92647.1 molybdopterin-guanine dinucleotide biosynthesis protein [Sanguibacter hominis ATCC BAA-789]
MSPSDNIDVRVTLVEWMAALERELGVSFGEVDIDALLDATRVAAHGVARPAGPLTTFAIGFAAGLSTGIATDSSAGEPDTTAAVRELSTKASALVSSWRPEAAGTAGDS